MNLNLPAEQEFLDRLTGIIEANLSDENFRVAELTREMGISHSTLHRKLKTIVNQSISRFIRETRMNHAMELLRMRAGTVAEIAYGVGFSSTTYFTKCFHDHFGYPPSKVKDRFVTVPELIEDQSFPLKSGKSIDSIAVLPFDNFTGDLSQSYLVSGMHDALIGELGELEGIRVISKTSTLSYLNSEKTIREIATDLNVDSIIEGSLIEVGDSLRIQLKMFSAYPEEKLVWTRTFEANLGDILKLYSEVIKNIVVEIKLKLSPEKQTRLDESRQVHPESYKAYLRGKYNLLQQTPEGIQKGLEYLHEAVRIDPAEPLAFAGLSLGYLDIAHGPFNAGDAYVKAESAGRQAIKLDPNLAEAQLAQAELCMYVSWTFQAAEKYFKRAIELNPNLSLAHYQYAWALFLFGRNKEALFEHELAWKCDPFNPVIATFHGAMLSYLGRHEDAISQVHKAFDMVKDFPPGYFVLGETYLAMGKEDLAIEAHQKLATLAPPWGWFLGYTYALTGHRDEALKILNQLEKTELSGWNALGLAVLYGALGMFDEAFKWIAYEPHHVWIPWVAVMPMWKPLYSDPRHAAYVKKLNLPK